MARAGWGDGSIRQVGPGRYQLRWSEGFDPFTGKHLRRAETITVKNLTEARRELKARTSITGRRNVSRMTVGQLIDNTIDDLAITDATRTRYRYALAHIPAPALDWVASETTVPQARMILDGLTERHGPQTVRKCYTALMSCWREARLRGWLRENPWAEQPLPRVKTSAGALITPEEITALISAAEPGLEFCWLMIHLATGARPGEVVGLRWSHVDHTDSTLAFIDAKHGGSERVVAVDDSVRLIVKDWQSKQQRTADENGIPLIDDPFLISPDVEASTPWRRAYAGGFRWRSLRERAGIRGELRLYDLRHTSNSQLGALGFDKAVRSARAGNSPATNERVYTHSTGDREAAEAIGSWLDAMTNRDDA
jgi:integrase